MFMRDRNHELRLIGWLLHAAGLVLLLAGSLLVYVVVFRPMTREQSETRSRIALLQRQLEAADDTRAQHAALRTSLDDIKRRAEIVRRRIPDQPHEAEFLSELTEIAGDEHVKIHDYRRGEIVEGKQLSQLTVQLKIEGEYAGICGFFDRLSKLPRVASVEKLDINAGSPSGVYPVDMTLVLYFGLQAALPEKGKERHGST